MARLAIIEKEKKKIKIVDQFRKKRLAIKEAIASASTPEEAWRLRFQLQKLPRNSCPVRVTKRCFETGRPRGVYHKRFGLSRNKLRDRIVFAQVPGVFKASW